MMIEVLGVHHKNKGARLMLEAIRSQLKDRAGVELAVPWGFPPELRLADGLWCTLPKSGRPLKAALRPNVANALRFMPRRVAREAGLVDGNMVDAILDASGFGYGDYWGVSKLRQRLAGPLRRWKNGHNKAILLPQALGPFTKPGMKEAFVEVLERADLVFARDRMSLAHVEAVAKDHPKVRLAPDFTNLLHAELPERLAHLRGKAMVIPNEKMVAGASTETRTAYVEFLVLSAELIVKSGRDAIVVVHEGSQDRMFADQINARLATPLRVVDEASVLTTKALIASADLIVSSRFHGLVSALAASVPSLACGWSHKYGELMADYGCPQHNINLSERGAWMGAIEALLADAGKPEFRARLAEASLLQQERSTAMWVEVMGVLDGAGQG